MVSSRRETEAARSEAARSSRRNRKATDAESLGEKQQSKAEEVRDTTTRVTAHTGRRGSNGSGNDDTGSGNAEGTLGGH